MNPDNSARPAALAPAPRMGHHPLMPPAAQRRNRSTTQAQALASAAKATQGDKIGRPLTYSPELCDRAVMLGKRGFTYSEIAEAFNISRETLYAWQRDYSEFSDALTRARTAMQAWYERHGRKNLKAKHYQANVMRLVLGANLEDYREKPKPISAELVDFLSAVVDAAGERQAKKLPPGDGAKAIEPLGLVVSDPVHDTAKRSKR